MISSADDQQLDGSICVLQRIPHSDALLGRDLRITVAVNQQNRSLDLRSNVDRGVSMGGVTHQWNIEGTDARVARRIPPKLNIGDRKKRDDGFDSPAASTGEQ